MDQFTLGGRQAQIRPTERWRVPKQSYQTSKNSCENENEPTHAMVINDRTYNWMTVDFSNNINHYEIE